MLIVVACDACGKQYRVEASRIGKLATCKECGVQFELTPLEKFAEAASAAPDQPAQPAQAASVEPEPSVIPLAGDEPQAPSRPRPTTASDHPARSSVCPGCSATVAPGTVICVQCGFNLKKGKRLATKVTRDIPSPFEPDATVGFPGSSGKREEAADEQEGVLSKFAWTLMIFGIGSSILPMFGYQFRRIIGMGEYAPFVGAGMGLLGAIIHCSVGRPGWGAVSGLGSIAAMCLYLAIGPKYEPESPELAKAEVQQQTVAVRQQPTVEEAAQKPLSFTRYRQGNQPGNQDQQPRSKSRKEGEDELSYTLRLIREGEGYEYDALERLKTQQIPPERIGEVQSVVQGQLNHAHPSMRLKARQILVSLAGKEGEVQALMAGVNEDAARRWCLEELAGRKVVAALPPLIELAATAAKAQWPETLEGYLPEFQSEVHRAMLGATHSNNPQTRFFALRFGPQKAPGEAWASRAMEILKDDPEAGVKNVAGVAAAELGLIDAIPLLEAAQNLNALEIFANQENNDAIRAILNILESENCPHEAYLVAGRLKLRDAAPLIVEKLLTSDWFFRREEVVAVLAQIDPAMGTPLRVAALEMSDSRKEKESIELLLKEPVPDDAETRNFVAHAVVRKILNRTSLQDKLMPLVERWNTPETTDFLLGEYPTAPPEQRSAILWMLLTVKHSQVAEMILVEYETNRFLVRNHLKHIVPEAEEAALKMLFDKDDEVAKRGCDLLEEIGTKKALVSLNAVAKNKRRSTQIQWAAESAARTILRRVHEEERRQERDKRIDRK